MPDQPNVLLVFSDQHRYCSMPGVDGCEVIAPNLRKLAQSGVSFTSSFSNYPVCGPARAMIISGRWPSDTGIVANEYELVPRPTSLGNVFQDAGYDTAYIGKWHLHGGPRENSDANDRYIPPGAGRHGFEHMVVWNQTNNHWHSMYYDETTGEPVRMHQVYNATRMTDQAIGFLGQATKPFFLFLSLNPPHPPLHDAPADCLTLYDDVDIGLRPNVPERFQSGRELVPAGARCNQITMPLSEEIRQYYAHITAIDREIGRVLSQLERLGTLENTIVIYTSDHGDMLGSQGKLRKGCFYRESAQVPLIFSWPARLARGETRHDLFSTIDLYPTLIGLAGMNVPQGARGMDLSGCVLDQEGPRRQKVLHFATRHGDTAFRQGTRGIRTQRHLYFTDGQTEHLYDEVEDPYERTDMALEPRYLSLKEQLSGWLSEELPGNMRIR